MRESRPSNQFDSFDSDEESTDSKSRTSTNVIFDCPGYTCARQLFPDIFGRRHCGGQPVPEPARLQPCCQIVPHLRGRCACELGPSLMGLPGPEQTSKIDHHSLSVLDDCGDESGCTFAKQVHHILPLDLGEDAPGTGVALNRLILRLSSIQASPWDGSLGSGLTSCRWILKVSKRTCPSAR